MSNKGAIIILTTIALAMMGWAGTSIVDQRVRLATVEANQRTLEDWLVRIDGNVITLLERLPKK
jgi:hypothetical protein